MFRYEVKVIVMWDMFARKGLKLMAEKRAFKDEGKDEEDDWHFTNSFKMAKLKMSGPDSGPSATGDDSAESPPQPPPRQQQEQENQHKMPESGGVSVSDLQAADGAGAQAVVGLANGTGSGMRGGGGGGGGGGGR